MARSERIELRVTPEEKAEMQRQADAHHRSLGDWLRLRALSAAHVSVEGPNERDLALAAELVREKAEMAEPPLQGQVSQDKPSFAGNAQALPTYRCPRDCNPSWRPSSSKARCPSCGKGVVPA